MARESPTLVSLRNRIDIHVHNRGMNREVLPELRSERLTHRAIIQPPQPFSCFRIHGPASGTAGGRTTKVDAYQLQLLKWPRNYSTM